MATEPKAKLVWQTIDVTRLAGIPKAKWDGYVKQREPIQAEVAKLEAKLEPARKELEDSVVSELIAQGIMNRGQDAVFAYRFGGMAVAVQDAQARTGKPKLVLGSDEAPARAARRNR